MADPGKLIGEEFKRGGTVKQSDFKWLIDFLRNRKENPGAVELLGFSVGHEGTYVEIVLLVQQDFVGTVCQKFADAKTFPTPFTIEVLNHAEPNPGQTILMVGWGGGR